MNRLLMQLVVDLTGFLELTDDDNLNPDLAVEQMEYVQATLLQLTPDELAVFRAYVEERLSEAQHNHAHPDVVKFLATFRDDLVENDEDLQADYDR